MVHSDWFQLGVIMPLIDIYIGHGSVNSIEAAFEYDVPVIIVSPQQAEQGINTMVVEKQGCGRVVWEHEFKSLNMIVHSVISDLTLYREAIRSLKSQLPEYYEPLKRRKLLVEAINTVFS